MKNTQNILIGSLFVFLGLFTQAAISQSCEGFWWPIFQSPGVGSLPRDIAYDPQRQITYVADAQDYGGDTDVQKVAAWDGEKWTKIGEFQCTSCGNGLIETLELDPQGNLYIGGFFEGVEDLQGNVVASKNIIKYNPNSQTFESLGRGLDGLAVYDIAWKNDTIFAAGSLTQAMNSSQNIPINNIALFDLNTQSWSAMGEGIGTFNLSTDDRGEVYALEFATTGELLVGGQFSKINGTDTVFSAARWTAGQGWSALSDGVRQFGTNQSFPGKVSDMAIDPLDGKIYIAGTFGPFYPTVGIGTGLAIIDGPTDPATSYSKELGRKSSGYWSTYAVHIDAQSRKLYVGGNFNSSDADIAYPTVGEYVAEKDLSSSAWNNMGGGLPNPQPGLEVSTIGQFRDQVMVGGNFTAFAEYACRKLVSYNSSDGLIDILGAGTHSPYDQIYAITDFMIGGSFEYLGGRKLGGLEVQAPNPTRTIGHLAMEGFNSPVVRDIVQKPKANGVVKDSFLVVGVFDSVGVGNTLGIPAIKTASMALITSVKQPGTRDHELISLASTLSGPGNFSTVSAAAWWQGQVIAGGNFTHIDGVSIAGLGIRSSNGSWMQLGNIQGGTVEDIYNDGDSLLYVGGTFTSVNGIQVDGIAVYDGVNWSALGQGFGFYHNVHVIRKDTFSGEIAVGGSFFTAYQSNGTSLNTAGLAFWDGSQWKSRGEVSAQITSPAQYSQTVRAIEFGPQGLMFIGGEFSGIDGVAANRIAKYEPGIGWSPLVIGIEGPNPIIGIPSVNVLHFQHEVLSVGGNFVRTGDIQASDFSWYDTRLNTLALIDTFRLDCELGETTVSSNIQSGVHWSTGDFGTEATIDFAYYNSLKNDNNRVWVYAEKDIRGCPLKDSMEVSWNGSQGVYEAFGVFQDGDSTYLWIDPGLDKYYNIYQAYIMEMEIPYVNYYDYFIYSDTLAFQALCPGTYHAIFYVDQVWCSVADTIEFTVSYEKPHNIVDELTPWTCGEARAFTYGELYNYQWSNGSDSSLSILDISYLNGQDRRWVYVEADTAYLRYGEDSLVCRIRDSVELILGENISGPIDQQYLIQQGDSFKVDFQRDFLGFVDWVNWDFGDGDTLAYYPDPDSGWQGESHTYPGPGNYRVRAIVFSYICGFDTLYFDLLVSPTSLESELPSSAIQLYPNPYRESLFLRSQVGDLLEGHLTILNSQGQIVWAHTLKLPPGGEIPLPLSHLSKGIYSLVLRDRNGHSWNQLFIKQ